MLSAKSIQSIKDFDNKRTIDKEVKFEVDSIRNVYHFYLSYFRYILDIDDKDEGVSIRMRAIMSRVKVLI
jgi:hypothetical protein